VKDRALEAKRARVLSEREAGASLSELAERWKARPNTVRNWLREARRTRSVRRELAEMQGEAE
jgi:transposase-like protein